MESRQTVGKESQGLQDHSLAVLDNGLASGKAGVAVASGKGPTLSDGNGALMASEHQLAGGPHASFDQVGPPAATRGIGRTQGQGLVPCLSHCLGAYCVLVGRCTSLTQKGPPTRSDKGGRVGLATQLRRPGGTSASTNGIDAEDLLQLIKNAERSEQRAHGAGWCPGHLAL